MATKRPFTPAFVNKLDGRLLKNNPVTWSTRVHLALYYGLAFSAVLALICFIVPEDARNQSGIYNWIILLVIVSLLAFITWMIFLLRFNVFKRFGIWKKTDSAKTFMCYFVIVCMIVSWPFIPPLVQSFRANRAYSGSEMVRDINSMNIMLCQLEKDSISTRFSRDTLQLLDSVEVVRHHTVNVGADSYTPVYAAILKERLKNADSVSKVSDSIYVVYECPDYQFVRSFFNYSAAYPGFMSSMDLFRQVLNSNLPVDTVKVKVELTRLLSKYTQTDTRNRWYGVEYYNTTLEPFSYANKISSKYDLATINDSIQNIAGKKYRWDPDTIQFSLRLLYYFAFVIVLLVTIYRHTTRRTFFLSLLTSVVLTILTSLLLAMQASSETAFFISLQVYFVLFALAAFTIKSSRTRNVIPGIAFNLLVFLTPFMPLVVTASYYSILEEKHFEKWEEKAHLFRNQELHYFLAEASGFILLLFLLTTLYQSAYRRWYALPQQ